MLCISLILNKGKRERAIAMATSFSAVVCIPSNIVPASVEDKKREGNSEQEGEWGMRGWEG